MSSRRGRATRADVAKLAGVSAAVVSYVLNDGPGRVAAATRQRVLDAVDVLGYEPNAAARALATGSAKLLGVVVPDISNPLYAELVVALEVAAGERGYALVLADSRNDPDVERRNFASLVGRRVDGILINSMLSPPEISTARERRIPVALLNALHRTPGFVGAGVDATEGARLATEHLIGHGHTRIGLLMGTDGTGAVEDRETGWLRTLVDHSLAPGPVEHTDFTRAGGYRAARAIFAGGDHPTALFASSDLMGVGALAALHDLGLSVPDDVAVMSFDGTDEARYTVPALSAVTQPTSEMARRLVELVLDPETPEEHYARFAPELTLRESCGCGARGSSRGRD